MSWHHPAAAVLAFPNPHPISDSLGGASFSLGDSSITDGELELGWGVLNDQLMEMEPDVTARRLGKTCSLRGSQRQLWRARLRDSETVLGVLAIREQSVLE